ARARRAARLVAGRAHVGSVYTRRLYGRARIRIRRLREHPRRSGRPARARAARARVRGARIMKPRLNIDKYRVRQRDRSPLKGRRPDDTAHFKDKADAEQHLSKGLKRLEERQGLLYAQDRYALLLIFQGMDASGKDSAISHVMSGVSPLGTEVHAFK